MYRAATYHRVWARTAGLKGLSTNTEYLVRIFRQFLLLLFGKTALGRIMVVTVFFPSSFHFRSDIFHLLQILFWRWPDVRLTLPRRIR